ncbi:MAG: Bug family tripartite tricarboxylate transporter substrate binding protein [Hyphomicrobiaceae bacterium]
MPNRKAIHLAIAMLACAGLWLGSLAPASAQDSVAEFYKGKNVTLIVGSSPGGGYDTYTRLIARHMGRHIPGNPNLIVQNLPGAGGNVLANQLASIGPKDGTTIGAPQSGVIFAPLLGLIPVKHDPSKFHYLGSANNDVYICVARADAPAKSFAEALEKEMVLAASNASSTADYAQILANTVGAKWRVVMGYTGSREIALAIDKGEAHGACGLAWPSISVTQSDWFTEGPTKSRMRVIVQTHATGHPELNAAGVPLAGSFAKTPEQKAILGLFFSQSQFGRPYILPAGTPSDRVAALRKAFGATMADPQFKAGAAKLKLDVDAVPGEVVQKVVADVYASPPDLIARTKKALQQRK